VEIPRCLEGRRDQTSARENPCGASLARSHLTGRPATLPNLKGTDYPIWGSVRRNYPTSILERYARRRCNLRACGCTPAGRPSSDVKGKQSRRTGAAAPSRTATGRRTTDEQLAFYAMFMAPLVDALGGEAAANREFFAWRGESTKDDRGLFRNILNGRRAVRADTAFTLGDFLGHHFKWCNGLVTLWAFDHLHAFVAVIDGMEARGADADQVAQFKQIPIAVAPFPLDIVRVGLGPRTNVLGSLFVAPDVNVRRILKEVLEFIPPEWIETERLETRLRFDLLERAKARAAITWSDTTAGHAKAAFEAWWSSGPSPRLLQSDDLHLQTAYAVAQSMGVRIQQRRIAVFDQLKEWHFNKHPPVKFDFIPINPE
jgi:hypothetical protein